MINLLHGVISSMDFLVALLRTLTMIVVWVMVDDDSGDCGGGGGGGSGAVVMAAAVILNFGGGQTDRRHSHSQTNHDWRRQALRLMDVVGSGQQRSPLRNCSSRPPTMQIPIDQVRRHFRRHFAVPLQSASQFVSVLQSTFFETASGGVPSSSSSSSSTIDQDFDGQSQSHRLYGSLSRAVVETDDVVIGCAIYVTQTRSSLTSYLEDFTDFVPYAYRSGGRVHTRNLFDGVVDYNASTRVPQSADEGLVLLANNRPVGQMLAAVVRTFKDTVANQSQPDSSTNDETWGLPWYNCSENAWFITYSLPLYEGERWRGALMVNVGLDQVDVDQCADSQLVLFGGTNLCPKDTMQCVHHGGQGFRRGAYRCDCADGFYAPSSSMTGNESFFRTDDDHFDGGQLEHRNDDRLNATTTNNVETLVIIGCLQCRPGCNTCEDASPCYADYDLVTRGIPLGLQSFCMTITIVLGVCVFQLRKCKVIAVGMWTVLEMILVGAFLIYSTVVIRYFEPMTLGCLLEPWLREMGFAICYGTIVLKLYRVLVEFRTRKAHRWVIRDKDLLKYLAGIVLVITVYMAAWTAISVDHIRRDGDSLVDVGRTAADGLKYAVCKSRWWDYVTETGEFVFLTFAVYITYHIRNASSPYKEKRYLCLAVYVEAIVSTTLHIFRHGVWLALHPDYIFLLYFFRCQLTVTVTLILIFVPKFWYHYRPPEDVDLGVGGGGGGGAGEHVKGQEAASGKESQDRLAAEMLKLQDGITSNGEVDIGEINLADMDPEDIRAELRRVYTQLQVLRNKTMRKDNPHISKRRGGRKATHRRFSLQAFHRHHRHHHDPEHETEISKTPEESTGSATETQQQPPPPMDHPSTSTTTTTQPPPEATTVSATATATCTTSALRTRQQVMF